MSSKRDVAAVLAEDGPEALVRSIESAGSSPLPTILRGSDVEFGAALVASITRASDGTRPVYDRGMLWRYDARHGVWCAVAEHEQERYLHRFDGLALGGGQPINIGHKKVKGSMACAWAMCAKPGFFDDAPPGIVFSNGFATVSQEGVQVRRHSPEHRAFHRLDYQFTPNAEAPRFEQFLREIFPEKDGLEKALMVQQFAGACLMGLATRFQRALFLVGFGANGKSVFLEILRSLFPKSAVTTIPPQDFDQEYRRAMFAGARLNAVSELPERDFMGASGFKAIVAGDEVTGRQIHSAPFSFVPVAGHIFSANSLPGSADYSDGFWRRIMVCEFGRTFSKDEQDTELAAKIIKSELPGVAAWALSGAANLLARGGYRIPESSKRRTEEWRTDTDQVRAFLDECCTVVAEPRAAASALYEDFKNWAAKNGHKPLSANRFAARLQACGLVRTRLNSGRFWNMEMKR